MKETHIDTIYKHNYQSKYYDSHFIVHISDMNVESSKPNRMKHHMENIVPLWSQINNEMLSNLNTIPL